MATVVSFSEAGGHPHNEDAFRVSPHPLDSGLMLCFVADGQGGRAGGKKAALTACDRAEETAQATAPQRLSDRQAWTDIVRWSDAAVEEEAEAGFTTFVGLGLTADRVVGASCGDSAALLVTPNGAVDLTRGQRKNPPVGSGAAEPVAFDAPLIEPWRVLVMTDGVWKYVGWQKIIGLAGRECGEALLSALQAAARLPGSGKFQDDFTVVLVESTPAARAGS